MKYLLDSLDLFEHGSWPKMNFLQITPTKYFVFTTISVQSFSVWLDLTPFPRTVVKAFTDQFYQTQIETETAH